MNIQISLNQVQRSLFSWLRKQSDNVVQSYPNIYINDQTNKKRGNISKSLSGISNEDGVHILTKLKFSYQSIYYIKEELMWHIYVKNQVTKP